MPMGKKYRWKLQIFWGSAWRTIMENDKRAILSEYMERCPDDLRMRIIDTTEEEEEKPHGRRH